MSPRLPSDALTKRTSPIKVAIVTIAAVVLVGGLGTAAFAFGPSLRAGLNPAPTPTMTPYVATLTPAEIASVQQGADEQQAIIVADQAAAAAAAAQAAADAAKAAAKKSSGWAAGQAPAGTPIPLHKDTDPNSGSYGQMVIEDPALFCAGKSGTTGSGGVQVCA